MDPEMCRHDRPAARLAPSDAAIRHPSLTKPADTSAAVAATGRDIARGHHHIPSHTQHRCIGVCRMNAIAQTSPAASLDPREEHVRIASPIAGLSLFLRHLPPTNAAAGEANRVVLYVHGGTFPSALSV